MAKIRRLNELKRNAETVSGRWELGAGHRLIYRSIENEKEIELQGSLVAVEPYALVLAVAEKQESGNVATRTARLTPTA